MKRQFYTLILLLVAGFATAQTQWVLTSTGVVSRSIVSFLHTPDVNTCWGVLRDSAGNSSATGVNKVVLTTDGATTWTIKTMPITGANTVAGLIPASVWAASATKAFVPMFSASGGNGKVMRTTNGGGTWTSAIAGAFLGAQGGFPDFALFFNANEGIVVGDPTSGYYEIWRTTDGGTTWTRVPSANIPAPSSANEYGLTNCYSVSGDHAWFGTTEGRVYHSADKGLTWTVASTPYATGLNYISTIAFQDATTGFAATNGNATTPQNNAELIKTTDGGATWTVVATPSAPTATNHASITYVPNTTNTYFMGCNSSGSFFSVDGGANWIAATEVNGNNSLADIKFSDATIGYSAGNYLSGTVGKWDGIIAAPTCLTILSPTMVSQPSICSGDTISLWTHIDRTLDPTMAMGVAYSIQDDFGAWSAPQAIADLTAVGFVPAFTPDAGVTDVGTYAITGVALTNQFGGATFTENARFKLQFFPKFCTGDTAVAAFTDVKLALQPNPTANPPYAGCGSAVVGGNTISLDITPCQSSPAVITYGISYSVNGAPAVAGSSFTTTTPGSYAVDFFLDNGVCVQTISGNLTVVGTDNTKTAANGLESFPNPATDHLVLKNINAATKNVQIIDVHGRVVLSQMPTNSAITISDLVNGVYFVQTIDANNTPLQRIRFVKQ